MIGLPRALLVGLAWPVILIAASAPADAHPFGDPQTLTLHADGDELIAQWQAGGLDDLTLLGVSLGVFPRNRVLLDGAIDTRPGDPEALAGDPAFAEYLTERIEITVDKEPCPVRVTDVSDLAEKGARLVATCRESGQVAVRSTMLTDLHPAYKLLATGPNGQRARYDVDHPTHTWSFGDSEGTSASGAAAAVTGLGRNAAIQIGAVLAGIVILTVAAVGVVRRRTRRLGRAA